MGYATSNETSDATPSATMLTALETLLTAHASWTFIEEISSPGVYRIWKNDNNDSSITFYVAIDGDTSNTQLRFTAFELWEADGADVPSRICPNPATTLTPAADASYATTGTWTGANWEVVTGDTSDYTYYMMVNNNGILLNTDQGTSGFTFPWWIGTWKAWMNNGNEYPVASIALADTDLDGGGSKTRSIGNESTSTTDAFQCSSVEGIYDHIAVNYSTLEGTQYPELENSSGIADYASAPVVRAGNFIIGRLHGTDVLFCRTNGGVVSQGDTVTIEGDTYAEVMIISATQDAVYVNTTA